MKKCLSVTQLFYTKSVNYDWNLAKMQQRCVLHWNVVWSAHENEIAENESENDVGATKQDKHWVK